MGYTTNQIYNELYEKVNGIYEIFKGFFGEDYVDLQIKNDIQFKHQIERFLESYHITGINYEKNDFDKVYDGITDDIICKIKEDFEREKSTIYVWWPNVTITNEYDKSINIQDLYAKVEIQLNGSIPYENTGFLLNRATYPVKQFICNYLHSHIQGIPKNDFTHFKSPCLGHGPIKDTIATLKNEYDEAIWMLFCQELSMYVTVESIQGGPWNRMESVGGRHLLDEYNDYNFNNANITAFTYQFTIIDLKNFIKYYLEHGHLSLSYRNQKYICGMPYYEYIIDISNVFIDYYNAHLSKTKKRLEDSFHNGLLNIAVLNNGRFYKSNSTIPSYALDRYRDKLILTFKGKEIRTKIFEDKEPTNDSIVTVINQNLAMFILNNILRTINFRYRNEYNNKDKREQTSTTTCQKAIFI